MSYTYEIPRGDSDNINVIMSDTDGVNIPFETSDTVYLTVKVDTNTETKILQKEKEESK